jgi:uncharacterized protein YbaP (TraB family)
VRRALFVVLVAWLLAPSARSEPGPGVPLFLWHLTRAGGGGERLALIGTLHFGPAGTTLPAEMGEALRAASALALEADVRDEEATLQAALARGSLPVQESLDERISTTTYRTLERFLEERGMPLSGLVRFEPWALGVLVATLQFERSGFHPEQGTERLLLQQLPPGLELVFLETVDEQLSIFDGLSAPLQEHLLSEALEGETEADLAELWSAWQRGDADAVARLVLESDTGADAEAFREQLFPRRNRRMLERGFEARPGGRGGAPPPTAPSR